MAGFKTHITTSTVLGVGYAGAAWYLLDVPAPTCVLAGGLCSVSGMLPDLDSDSGVPLRESIAFAAAVVPMLMLPRFRAMGLAPESVVLAGGLIYLMIRFGMARLLKHYTVHRGMFHSIPAALIATQLAFLICAREDLAVRYYHAGAVLLGFMSHLVLDEIWSLGMRHGHLYFKSSFGTAIKLWGQSRWGNLSAYAKVLILSYFVLQDPVWMNHATPPGQNLRRMANQAMERIWK